jgi:hypothetical protein
VLFMDSCICRELECYGGIYLISFYLQCDDIAVTLGVACQTHRAGNALDAPNSIFDRLAIVKLALKEKVVAMHCFSLELLENRGHDYE